MIKNAATIGIIGGADGPTAVFVTSRLAHPGILALAALALAAVAAVIIIKRRK